MENGHAQDDHHGTGWFYLAQVTTAALRARLRSAGGKTVTFLNLIERRLANPPIFIA